MSVQFTDIPTDIRVPLFYAEVDSSLAGKSTSTYPSLLFGQKTSAGSATANVPVLVSSESQAISLFGAGSMLAQMCAYYISNDPFGVLYAMPLDDVGAGVAATSTITVGVTTALSGTANIYFGPQRVQVAVVAGDAAADIATAIAAAITADTSLPVTASVAGGTPTVVDVVAKNKGTLGNSLYIRENYLGAMGGEATPGGVTLTIVQPSFAAAGATDPTLTTAIAAMASTAYDYIGNPYTDTTSLNAIKSEMTDRWSFDHQIYGEVIGAKNDSLSDLSSFGAGRNAPHEHVFGAEETIPMAPWQLTGAATGRAAKSLRQHAAQPLQTLVLEDCYPPPASDRFTITEHNTLLHTGVATLDYQGAEGGSVRIQRAISTFQTDAYGNASDAWLDIQTGATLAYVLRTLKSAVESKFARKILVGNDSRSTNSATVTPNQIKAEIIAKYNDLELSGHVENAAVFAANLIVERSSTDPNRVDVFFPPDLANQLRVVALLAQYRLQYSESEAA